MIDGGVDVENILTNFDRMMTSSREQLPARSPIPFIAPSTCRAPACTAASELPTARPNRRGMYGNNGFVDVGYAFIQAADDSGELKWHGVATVSGMLMVVAPALIAASTTRARSAIGVRPASSQENSTSSV